MGLTLTFFLWFFSGLGGLGGWFLFMLLAVAAVVWLLYDSSRRRLPALGWKTGILLLAALMIPAIIFRFSADNTQLSLTPFVEAIFYLGLLGGILPAVLAIGYFVTYQGMVGCNQGHVYEEKLGRCPVCAREAIANQPVYQPPVQPVMREPAPPPPPAFAEPPAPVKPKAQAWLVAQDGRSYQLYCNETSLGRSSENDIQISDDTTVSRTHVKIQEHNGRFRLVDVGSTGGTRLNNKLLRQPSTLEPDDEIRLGDNTVLRFVTARR